MTETMLLVKEIWCRKIRFLLGLGVVSAGVAIVVSVQTISSSFEEASMEAMNRLGPTAFLIPVELPPSEYLMRNFGDMTFPQNIVETLKTLDIPGVDKLEPRLLKEWKIGQTPIVLAGVSDNDPLQPRSRYQIVVGAEIARMANLDPGASMIVNSQNLVVSQVLPPRGDVTDLTVFFRLATLQRIFNKGSLVNEIGVTLSSHQAQARLESAVATWLPGLHAVTRGRILEARLQLARGLRKQALAIAIVILALGSVSISNYMAANVRERRQEIGTLMALGASSSKVLMLFLKKAVAMGTVGGLIGFTIGSAVAYVFAPSLAGIPIRFLPILLPASIALAGICALVGSATPFARAARTDPATVLSQAGY